LQPCHGDDDASILTAMLRHLAIARRSLRRAPQWVALLAMLTQFVASYGHIHPQDYNSLRHGHAALSWTAAAAGPNTGIDGIAVDTDCPVCASISLLGSSALPDGVRMLMPPLAASATTAAFAALHLTPAPHLLFDTRGPPRA
jgi:hypothetical protein